MFASDAMASESGPNEARRAEPEWSRREGRMTSDVQVACQHVRYITFYSMLQSDSC